MLHFFIRKLSSKQDDMTFWEHAEVLRRHLIRSVAAVVILAIAAFFFKSFIIDTIILGPKDIQFPTYRALCYLGRLVGTDVLCLQEVPIKLINTEIGGQFRWHIIISMVAGLILAFPFIVWQLWLFIKPALRPGEKKKSRGMILYITLLFTTGVLFGYYVILPLTLNFLANYTLSKEFGNFITISSYISVTTMLPLSTGLVFELPVLVYFLAKIGLLGPNFLKKYRKHAVIAILIIAGIITPSTDILSQLLVSLPLFILYQISIGIARRAYVPDLAG